MRLKNTPAGGYLYIFKHGIGPGTMPSDVEIIKTKDLPNYYTAVWLSDFLTTDELKQYDIPDETRINSILDSIGYCQKNGDVVPCGGVEACGKVTAYSQMSSRRGRSVTKEVLDYLADQYPNSGLYKELVDKDIWINLWPDGEYNLSYNSVKNPETFLTDASADELVKVMTELYPNSFWGDLVGVEACDKVAASDDFDDDEDKIYWVQAYYGTPRRGMATDFATNDWDEAVDKLVEYANQGYHVVFENLASGEGYAYDADEILEAVDLGDIYTLRRLESLYEDEG
jgi:hypothetical protein